MRLIIITRDYPDVFGGVSDYTYHLSNSLSEKGIQISILTSDDKRIKINSENNVELFPVIKDWGFFCLPKIFQIIDKVKPDVVSLQYVPYMYNFYGVPVWIIFFALWLSLKRIKLVTTFHEIAIAFDFLKPKYWLVVILQRFIAYCLAFASFKIIVSIEHSVKMLYPSQRKIVKIPVGSNIIPFDISENEKALLREKIAPKDEKIISTLGAAGYFRRNDLLLKAVKMIMDSKNSTLLKVVFLGKISDYLKQGLEEEASRLNLRACIHFPGFLESSDVYRYLSISDIYILLSTDMREGTGIKSTSVAAAYAAGLPIIGVKGIVTDDFFKNGENILFADSITAEDVAKAIWKLLKDEELRNKLRTGARNTYKEKLEWSVLANRYIKVLEKY